MIGTRAPYNRRRIRTAPPPHPGATPEPPEQGSWEASCVRALATGRAAHPALELEAQVYAAEVAARIDDRLRRAEAPITSEARTRWLERAAHADLLLAVACGRGLAGAWERLMAELGPRILGLARARGADPAEAERLAADLLGDLALPASGDDPRPLLATYAGGGSLFAFAAVLLARAQARRARDPRERRRAAGTLEAVMEDSPPRSARTLPLLTPAAAAMVADQARCFERALAAAVSRLTPSEALALALKHRDGTSQATIATLLGVGAPRVSRILASAVARLRAAVRERCPDLVAGESPEAGPEALSDVVARHLSTLGSASLPGRSGNMAKGR